MSAEVITSRHNPLVKHARAVREGKVPDLIFVEGVRLCEEAARSATVEDVLYTERLTFDARGDVLLETLKRDSRRVVPVTPDVLASVADAKTPQGVVVIARRPRTDWGSFQRRTEIFTVTPLIVVAHGINNPANVGAMLRVAEAAGATGFIVTEGSVDVFSPKALRGAMGSSFRLPVWTGARLADVLAWCARRGIATVGTDARAAKTHTNLDWNAPRAIICGAEAGGLTADDSASTNEMIRIPMRAPVESLNVATALAVILYEAARQRDAQTVGEGGKGKG